MALPKHADKECPKSFKGMAPDNHRAYRFYKALGFVEIGRSAAGHGHLPALESSHS